MFRITKGPSSGMLPHHHPEDDLNDDQNILEQF